MNDVGYSTWAHGGFREHCFISLFLVMTFKWQTLLWVQKLLNQGDEVFGFNLASYTEGNHTFHLSVLSVLALNCNLLSKMLQKASLSSKECIFFFVLHL